MISIRHIIPQETSFLLENNLYITYDYVISFNTRTLSQSLHTKLVIGLFSMESNISSNTLFVNPPRTNYNHSIAILL